MLLCVKYSDFGTRLDGNISYFTKGIQNCKWNLKRLCNISNVVNNDKI